MFVLKKQSNVLTVMLCFVFVFLLTHQNLGTSSCASKIGYRSQKQPELPPETWYKCKEKLQGDKKKNPLPACQWMKTKC